MYGVLPSFAARTLAEVPLRLVQCLIFCCNVYWATGMNDNFSRFLLFVAGLFFTIVGGVGIAEAASFLGPDGPTATLIHSVYLILNVLTCGFLGASTLMTARARPTHALSA